jgi:hypothetical protein
MACLGSWASVASHYLTIQRERIASSNALNNADQVRTPTIVSACIWRRIVGATLVFALLFQGLIFASVGAALAGSIARDTSWSAFEPCRHNAADEPLPTNELPTDHSDCSQYCIFYRAAGTHTPAAPEVSAVLLPLTAIATQVQWSLAKWHFQSRYGHNPNSRPRGPPLSA